MKIALLGSAPSSRLLAPFNDPEWEIWCCSPPNYDLARVDAWFEVHCLDRKMMNPQNAPYVEVLKKHPRVYVTDPRRKEKLPNAIDFPWQVLVSKHGPYFFTSSLAWMMAYALEHNPDKIGLWGVDMSAHEEYGYQRAGCQFFIQKAHEQGVEVYCPPQSDVKLPPPLYGVREHWPMWKKTQARKQELKERLQTAEKALEAARNDALVIKGAMDDMQYVENTWVQPNWVEVHPNVAVAEQPENTPEN